MLKTKMFKCKENVTTVRKEGQLAVSVNCVFTTERALTILVSLD